MTTYEAIKARRSVRNYEMRGLPQHLLAQIGYDIAHLRPLYSRKVRIAFELLTGDQMKESYRVAQRAPYYIVVLAEPTSAGRISAGFMGEQLVLSLTSIGLGTCWLGSVFSKKSVPREIPLLIAISFGRPLESGLLETEYTHKRKPLDKLLIGTDKPSPLMREALSAARLAPSGVNLQPCRYLMNGDAVAMVRRKALLPRIDRMHDIDCGIALAHIDTAARDEGLTVAETDLSAFAKSIPEYQYVHGLILQHSHEHNLT